MCQSVHSSYVSVDGMLCYDYAGNQSLRCEKTSSEDNVKMVVSIKDGNEVGNDDGVVGGEDDDEDGGWWGGAWGWW